MQRVRMALVVLVSLGCFDDGIVGSSTVTGNYTLRTINGSPLPYTISGSGTNKTEIIDDVITLYQGFTYAESGSSRTTVNGQATTAPIAKTGAYSLLGTSIILSSNDGTLERRGTIKANTMTIVEAGKTSVLEK